MEITCDVCNCKFDPSMDFYEDAEFNEVLEYYRYGADICSTCSFQLDEKLRKATKEFFNSVVTER